MGSMFGQLGIFNLINGKSFFLGENIWLPGYLNRKLSINLISFESLWEHLSNRWSYDMMGGENLNFSICNSNIFGTTRYIKTYVTILERPECRLRCGMQMLITDKGSIFDFVWVFEKDPVQKTLFLYYSGTD